MSHRQTDRHVEGRISTEGTELYLEIRGLRKAKGGEETEKGFGSRELEQPHIFTESVSKVRPRAKYRRAWAGCGSEVMAWVRGGVGARRVSSQSRRLHSVRERV